MAKKKKGVFGKKTYQMPAAPANKPTSKQLRRGADFDGYNPNLTQGSVMEEVARNTANKMAHWDQSSRLRDRPVIFVSGGFFGPCTESKSIGNVTASAPSLLKADDETTTETREQRFLAPNISISHHPTTTLSGLPQSALDNDSDSGEEIILFKGRGKKRHIRPNVPNAPASYCPPSDDETRSDIARDDYIANMLENEVQGTIGQEDANCQDLGDSDGDIVFDGSGLHCIDDASGVRLDASSSEHERAPTADLVEGGCEKVAVRSGTPTSLDDEQLAMLLSKQEALGLGGEDLLLFDANSANVVPKKRAIRSAKKLSLSWKHIRPGQFDFVNARNSSYTSAEAVADAFERLDMTGWKQTNDRFQVELSDSELEANLKATWQTDRQRKKEKKQARETLRAQGLLGKNADANDPRVKYPNGMNLDDIRTEFHTFLVGSASCATFPPMDASSRKIIHELSNRFNIASKSSGAGDQRRAMIVRTKSTVPYDEDQFQSVFARTRRRYFPRLDGPTGSKRSSGDIGRHGGNVGAAIVRHGEVVGGSAPAIGETNKGREMLEKMGWSMGMALGATDNKGITLPIEHIMKRSKAGLG